MKELTNLEWYILCIKIFKKFRVYKNIHAHHIKPKSIYPELANDYKNLVNVPDVVHWALHIWLLRHYQETNNEVGIEKMSKADVASYINDTLKSSHIRINFNDTETLLTYIKQTIEKFLKSKIKYEKKLTSYQISQMNVVTIFSSSKDGSALKLKCNDDYVKRKLKQFHTKTYVNPRDKYQTEGFEIKTADLKEFEDACAKFGYIITRTLAEKRSKELSISHFPQHCMPPIDNSKNILMQLHDSFVKEFGYKIYDELDVDNANVDNIIMKFGLEGYDDLPLFALDI